MIVEPRIRRSTGRIVRIDHQVAGIRDGRVGRRPVDLVVGHAADRSDQSADGHPRLESAGGGSSNQLRLRRLEDQAAFAAAVRGAGAVERRRHRHDGRLLDRNFPLFVDEVHVRGADVIQFQVKCGPLVPVVPLRVRVIPGNVGRDRRIDGLLQEGDHCLVEGQLLPLDAVDHAAVGGGDVKRRLRIGDPVVRVVVEVPPVREVFVVLEDGDVAIRIELIDQVDGKLSHLLQLVVGIERADAGDGLVRSRCVVLVVVPAAHQVEQRVDVPRQPLTVVAGQPLLLLHSLPAVQLFGSMLMHVADTVGRVRGTERSPCWATWPADWSPSDAASADECGT